MAYKSLKKILVVCLDNIGDAIMASSLFPALRHLFPKAKLGFWVKDYAASVFSTDTTLNTLHASDPFWDSSPGRPKGRIAPFLKTLRKIEAEKYEAALILNTEWRRALAVRWVGIPRRIGYNQRKSSPFLTTGVAGDQKGPHFIDDHRILLETWVSESLDQNLFKPHLTLAELKSGGLNTVTLHPFSGDSRKTWPLPFWKALIKFFTKEIRNLHINILGDDKEANKMTGLKETLPNKIHLFSGVSLSEVKSIIGSSQLFIGNDSGPGHIAGALGVPMVSLFGLDNAKRCAPIGKGRIKILSGFPIQTLAPETVQKEILSFLKDSPETEKILASPLAKKSSEERG